MSPGLPQLRQMSHGRRSGRHKGPGQKSHLCHFHQKVVQALLRFSLFDLRIIDFPGIQQTSKMAIWVRIRPEHRGDCLLVFESLQDLLKARDGVETVLLYTDFYALYLPGLSHRLAGYEVSVSASLNQHVYIHKANVDVRQSQKQQFSPLRGISSRRASGRRTWTGFTSTSTSTT